MRLKGRGDYAHQLDVEGRRIEVRPDSNWRKHTLRLSVDGEIFDESSHTTHNRFKLEGEGFEIRARTNLMGNVQRAELVRGEGNVLLAPEPGSPAAELEKLATDRPKVYAARHVGKSLAGILAGVLGLGALFGFLLPEIDLGINLPEIELPGWAQIAAKILGYAIPVLIASAIAVREYRRRRRRGDLGATDE